MAEPPATQGSPDAPGPASGRRSALYLLLAAGLALLMGLLLPAPAPVAKGLALTVFIGLLWLSEALPLAVTALLVPLLALLLGFPGLGTTQALAPFADPVVFLFLGGFALAAAMRAQQLDRKLAFALLAWSRGRLGWAVGLLFAATAIVSMGISNTATAAMMLPLALGLLRQVDPVRDRATHVFVLLGVAYAASLGGLGTLVGSPPNAIAARAAGLDFSDWLGIGLPLVTLLLPLMVLVLWWVLRPSLGQRVELELEALPWTRGRLLTLAVFGCAVLGWTFGGGYLKRLGIQSPDSFVALAALVLVIAMRLVSWDELARQTDWGVLLLFGGGLALGEILDRSGAALWLGQQVAQWLQGASPFWILLVVAAFMVLLSEFASNTAAAALLVPVFAAVAGRIGLPPELLVVTVAVAASCGFALPVATPPNALVYGTGRIAPREMLRAGLALDLVCVLVVTAGAWLLLSLR